MFSLYLGHVQPRQTTATRCTPFSEPLTYIYFPTWIVEGGAWFDSLCAPYGWSHFIRFILRRFIKCRVRIEYIQKVKYLSFLSNRCSEDWTRPHWVAWNRKKVTFHLHARKTLARQQRLESAQNPLIASLTHWLEFATNRRWTNRSTDRWV